MLLWENKELPKARCDAFLSLFYYSMRVKELYVVVFICLYLHALSRKIRDTQVSSCYSSTKKKKKKDQVFEPAPYSKSLS